MKPVQYILMIVWLIVVISFVLGISLPIATIKKFWLIQNEFSLLSSISELANDLTGQNILLLIIIVLFTLVFPIAKLITMIIQINNYDTNWQNQMTRIVETIGHFSMLDVFVIALMVLLLKLRVLVDVEVHFGFYWFTLSIILGVLLSFGIKRLRQQKFNLTDRN